MDDKRISRRDFLTLRQRPAGGPSAAAPPPPPPPIARPSCIAGPALPAERRAGPAAAFLRPPGALPEPLFLDACQRCGRCVEACPHDVIRPLGEGPGAGTPHIAPRKSPCQLCPGLPCTHACPSGALRPLGDPRAVRMGAAVIDAGQCLAYRGAPCRACVDVCPLPGVLRFSPGEARSASPSEGGRRPPPDRQARSAGQGRAVYVPVAGPESCVGCGVCHRYCPPAAIRIVPVEGEAMRVRIEEAVPAASTG